MSFCHRFQRSGRKTRKGFTLLETLLSVALLLILTMIIYQGFMSTLKLSTNTANYQKTANVANSGANSALSNPAAAAGVTSSVVFTPPVGIGGGTKTLPVKVSAIVPAAPVILDAEDNTSVATTHRYAFTYISPAPGP